MTNEIVAYHKPSVIQIIDQRNRLAALIDETFVYGTDWGTVQGIKKPFLFLPGITKVCKLLGVYPTYKDIHVERDFDTPFFYYEVECTLRSIQLGGEPVMSASATAHTKEKSYGIKKVNRWDEKERRNKYVDANDEEKRQHLYDQINKCRKVANKRAWSSCANAYGLLEEHFASDKHEGSINVINIEYEPLSSPTALIKLRDLLGRRLTQKQMAAALGVEAWGDFDGTVLDAYTKLSHHLWEHPGEAPEFMQPKVEPDKDIMEYATEEAGTTTTT